MKSPAPVIVIKKRRKEHHQGHHSGAWKVAYADFVTAMMAFFMVLWIIGQSEDVKTAVAGYFRDPGIFEHKKSTGMFEGGDLSLEPGAAFALQPLSNDEVARSRRTLELAAGRIAELLMRVPEFRMIREHIEIQMTAEGLRIELLDSSESSFFDTASTQVKPVTARVLTALARELSALRNPVVIEGHTDGRPYTGSDLYTNWELSTDRAHAARRIMERGGLNAAQMNGVRGYADSHLRVPGEPLNDRNRRVSIIVQHER